MAAGEPSVDGLFCAVIELQSPDERQAYLDQACGGDVKMRCQVERLLRAHFGAGSFLNAPARGSDATLDQPITEKPGTVIDRYKLLEQIGEGGFGVVFMAEQQEPVRRKVALKIIKPGMDTKEVIARFQAERQALALMDHPNIARVLDAGATESGRPYFVMELVRGIPITDYCDQNNLSAQERLELFGSVCQAVQHAHQKGIIHRDIKPSNVMITLRDDRPVAKVIDFGVAKATNARMTEKTLFTRFGQMVGTPLYMSPEQAGMSELDVDTRSDIYSLGVLLYELLTGTTPFDQQRIREAAYDELLHIIREEEPPKPSTRVSTQGEAATASSAHRKTDPRRLSQFLRGELDWIVMKAMEKDRTRRYETANGFARDIERYLNDEPVTACPPSAAYRLRKFACRNRGFLITILVVSAALLLGTVVSTWQAYRATRAEHDAKIGWRAEQRAHEEAHRAGQDARRRLFDTYVAQARASRETGRPGQRIDSLQALANAAEMIPSLDLGLDQTLQVRNEALACMGLVDIRPLRQWELPADDYWVTFDRDLRRYACLDAEGSLSVRRTQDDQEILRIPHSYGRCDHRQFSPDGRYLAGRFPPVCHVWDLQRPSPTPVFSCSSTDHPRGFDFDFSPDSRRLAVASTDETVRLFDVQTGQQLDSFNGGSESCRVRFHPDGEKLAVCRGIMVDLWDLGAHAKIRSFEHPGAVDHVAWRPDGKLLACGAKGGFDCYVWDAETGEPRSVLRGHRNVGFELQFSPDGKLLSTNSWDGTTRLWEPMSGRQLLWAEWRGRWFSADGGRLALRDGGRGAGIWELAGLPECESLPTYPTSGDGSKAVDFCWDRRLMASAGAKGVRLWDLSTRRQIAFLPIGPIASIFFHQPSRSLLSSGNGGLLRWPLVISQEDGLVRIGPPEKLKPLDRPIAAYFPAAALSRDGHLVAVVASTDQVAVLDPTQPEKMVLLDGHEKVNAPALSPDGTWAATGTWHGRGVKVWQTESGSLVQTLLPDCGNARAAFSPDGKWLATSSGNEYRLWETGAWKPAVRIARETTGSNGRPMAFSPDGAILAVIGTRGAVRLLDPANGEEMATLLSPDVYSNRLEQICFNHDGSLLAVVNLWRIILWDLRRARQRLGRLNVGWDLPPHSREVPPASAQPLRVEVELGFAAAGPHLTSGKLHYRARRWQEVIREAGQAIELAPEDHVGYSLRAQARLKLGEYESAVADLDQSGGPLTCDSVVNNSIAWDLVVRPESGRRYAQRAVARAQRAVELKPQNGNYWNTLGVAHYRAGNWDPAVEALAKSDELFRGDRFSINGFFLAMAHWQKGDRKEAQALYEKSVAWMDEHMPNDAELRGFRDEATELIDASDDARSEATEDGDDQPENR